MDANNLLAVLKKKFEIKTDKDLAETIGISIATINNWKSNSAELTPHQIGNLIDKVRKKEKEDLITNVIQPLVEYYEVEHFDSRQGANWELIPSGDGRGKKIRACLENSKGIYIFYNSQCKAIYVGKAKKQSLWKEMTLAFNRDRASQKVWLVQHPSTGQSFEPAYNKLRPLKKTKVFLSEIASYFSAYKVSIDLIDNIEALLIRGFTNDLTNTRMEKFKFK